MFEYMADAEAVADEIAKLYLKSSRYLSNELDKIFSRFRRKHHLSEAKARQLLNKMQDKASLDELKRVLSQEKDDAIKAELLAGLEAPAYQARLEAFQQKQNQIDMVMRGRIRGRKRYAIPASMLTLPMRAIISPCLTSNSAQDTDLPFLW